MKIICSKKSFIYCNFPKVEKCADKNLPEKVKNLLSEIERREPSWRARGIAGIQNSKRALPTFLARDAIAAASCTHPREW